jgi:hypothetical protein
LHDLIRISVRLPADAAAVLRATAFVARLQPAVLARALLVRAIETGELPQPAPPVLDALAPADRAMLVALVATQSNLSQLTQHARELGEPLARLAVQGGAIDTMSAHVRALGLSLKAGASAPAEADRLHAAAAQLNGLAKRLNADRRAVPISDWHAPLADLKAALTALAK